MSETPETPLPAVRRSAYPVPTLRWHESWIVRAAAIASLILFVGYAVGAVFTFQSIDSVANVAHDPDIEDSLGAHLDSIKRTHELQQQLILERLKNVSDRPADITRALEAPDMKAMIGPLPVRIEEPSSDLERARTDMRWLDRDRLQLKSLLLIFPKGATYESFKAAEDIRQRYQLIGVKLDENIRPTLIRMSAMILIVSFILMASLFFVYAQRFRARTFEVIEGFSIWSEKDDKFRFDEHSGSYQGELRLITHQFNAMADEVEANRQRSLYLEKIASWQIIARKLAHEIKNPLTPIQMMVSQLKRRYKGEDKEFGKLLDDAQKIISEEVAGLRRMVDNFSNFARLPEPEPRPTDLIQMCRHVIELQKNAFPQHTLTFSSTMTKAIAVVDDDLLRQVLLNLIKNAAEAAGETPAAIHIGVEITKGYVSIAVHDTGPGIPADLKARIFEAYFTTKHTGPNPGMGLGLAVCQKIVLDHAGTMTVDSHPGNTTFTIRLPLKERETS